MAEDLPRFMPPIEVEKKAIWIDILGAVLEHGGKANLRTVLNTQIVTLRIELLDISGNQNG
jgi:hypothetical protein